MAARLLRRKRERPAFYSVFRRFCAPDLVAFFFFFAHWVFLMSSVSFFSPLHNLTFITGWLLSFLVVPKDIWNLVILKLCT